LLASVPGNFGRVLDAGAGRGQFSLFLHELGRASELVGYDTDTRKIALFRVAAGSMAHVEARDLLDLPEGNADTVLLIDVLHYLALSEQDELLRRVAAHVPTGRILIRELDASPRARSWVTRALEWIAKVSGYNRGRAARHYRPASELVRALTQLGFSCEVQGASAGTPFANVLIVAARC
jgi:2-polyprenyl-3-methyl-5-hydroxy-6-metoxy-1,4-benzoquinol methylase